MKALALAVLVATPYGDVSFVYKPVIEPERREWRTRAEVERDVRDGAASAHRLCRVVWPERDGYFACMGHHGFLIEIK